MKHLINILLLSTISLSVIAQINIEAIENRYNKHFEKFMKKNKIQGLSFALVSKDSIIFQLNLGHSDDDLSEKVTPKTLFGLGSVTKVFTGVAVMQLEEQGKVRLDQPLQEYLSKFNIKGENINDVTVRNVMTHHSGLPSDIIKGMFTHDPEDYEQLVAYINEEYLANKPALIRAYSNPGYTLLGHMVAEVSEKRYQEYMQEELFSKIGMHQSGFNLRDQASSTFNGKGKPDKDVLLRDIPAGGLYSNAEEMAIFLRAFLNQDERLLTEESYQQIFTQHHADLALNFENRYTLCCRLTSKPHSGNIYTHSGSTLYYNSAIAVAPEVGLAAVILTNSKNGGSAQGSIMTAIDDVAKELGYPTSKTKKIEAFETTTVIDLPDSVTDELVGQYGQPGVVLDVYKKRDKLYMRMQGLKIRLLPVENNVFIPKILLMGFIPIKMSEIRFLFEQIEGYNVITQTEIGSGKELLAVKINRNDISDKWKDRIGKYNVVNKLKGEIDFFTDFELINKNGLLVMVFKQEKQKIEMALDIIDDSRAKVAGLGRYAGQSVLVEKDTLKFFGIQLQKINK